ESSGLAEYLRVVDGHGSRRGEQLAELYGMLVEDVLAVGVDVDRANHLIREQQRQRERAVHSETSDPGSESRPHLLPAERARTYGAPFQRGGDARALLDRDVLDLVNLGDER